jgi:hypothetical protein
MEQVESPHCTTFVPGTPNSTPATTCVGAHDYTTKYFFFTLGDHELEVPSLCFSDLGSNFHKEDNGMTTRDEKRFNEPIWPGPGEWPLTLYGEQYTYKSTGQNEGALWYGQRGIGCSGDLKQHGK